VSRISEGGLEFAFPAGWEVSKYDGWAFYRRHFQKTAASKGVDILALGPRPGKTLWMIEVKDYRRNPRTKKIPIHDEITRKVRDTLAGILAATVRASVAQEQKFAQQCVRARNLRVALHLEQPAKTSKLFPRAFNAANLQLKLQSTIKAVDPHPKVVDRLNLDWSMDWTVVLAGSGPA
jgi:hypothetical protein